MNTISEVLQRLEAIIQECRAEQSALGYFPALYYRMTEAVQTGIAQGVFENGARMEQLDVRFAQRYIDAYDAYRAGKHLTQSWRLAFEATKDDNVTVFQHLILGMNAHINLDLSIAAAQTRTRDAIFGLHDDFNKINDVIRNLVDPMQEKLAEIWLPFRLLDRLLRTEDEGWINFSIDVARGAAWKAATVLAFAPDMQAEKKLIQDLDVIVASIGKGVLHPGFWISSGLWLMRRWEKGTTAEKIDVLLAP